MAELLQQKLQQIDEKVKDVSLTKDDKETQEKIEEEIKNRDANEATTLGALNTYQIQKKKLDFLMNREIRIIQQKYDILSLPLIEKQREIIQGRILTDEEVNGAKKVLSDEQIQQLPEQKDKALSIANYWMNCLIHGEETSPDVKEEDEDALKYLKNVRVESKQYEETNEWNNTLESFTLFFEFSPNAYFTNEVLTKQIIIDEDEECQNTVGTTINWKEGKNLTKKQMKKSQKNKKTGQKRIITKEVEAESFFNFFKTTEFKEEEEDLDNEEDGPQESIHDIHVDVGRFIIDDLIPYSIEHFLDVKEKDEENFDDFADEFDDADEDDEEDRHVKRDNKKKKKSKKSQDKGGEEKPECKQQ